MNRFAVVTSLLSAVPTAYAAGELALIDSLGVIVDATHFGPYAPPAVVDIFVGTPAATPRQVGVINPKNFSYETLAYRAAVGQTIRVGYTGSASNIVLADPTLTANLAKAGTLSLTYHSLDKSSSPAWGNVFQKDVQVAAGDTVALVLARLVVAATAITSDMNTRLGTGTITFTSDVASTNKYLNFVVAKNFQVDVKIDGIFEGTPVTITAGTAGPFFSGTSGVEIQALELEGAVLDGYNPSQTNMYQTFPLANYVSAVAASNYDAIIIRTTSAKQYPSPSHPAGWDVEMVLYFANTTPGTVGAGAAAVAALLLLIKEANQGLTSVEGDALFLTPAEGGAAYSAIGHTHT